MKPTVTSAKSYDNCDLHVHDYGVEKLYLIKATGPIDRRQRAIVFKDVLEINKTANFFYILDNRGGYEIELSPADMSFLNALLYEGGIRYIRGAVVTLDVAYNLLVSLAKAKARAENFEVELVSTTMFADAEEFVTSKMQELMKVRQD
ncbi:hypothetical protein J0X12_07870 [Sneathiella sp. CAU 1612]|uniref:Uncharacterized protein n=1 Tax=Sneathiella sedimenti TaxID=2816034 RepID=A0ABS3F4S3_9PROT|nr:hypothetical protein [Sneathiella sedimenti]MBO0333524.1 hypothetical protein [Sneathiella sedimenti]